MSALCSSLAKGCEKQYLAEESGLYMQLADYFKSKMSIPDESTFPELLELVNNNLSAQITEPIMKQNLHLTEARKEF